MSALGGKTIAIGTQAMQMPIAAKAGAFTTTYGKVRDRKWIQSLKRESTVAKGIACSLKRRHTIWTKAVESVVVRSTLYRRTSATDMIETIVCETVVDTTFLSRYRKKPMCATATRIAKS